MTGGGVPSTRGAGAARGGGDALRDGDGAAAVRRAATIAIIAAVAEATAETDASRAEPVTADANASRRPATAVLASTIRVVRSSGGVVTPSFRTSICPPTIAVL